MKRSAESMTAGNMSREVHITGEKWRAYDSGKCVQKKSGKGRTAGSFFRKGMRGI